ncbi:NAD(P)/FAD-dependent oxidoreductase [Antrihabitans stalactiti]|uniref:NAD(P)/FAD-dependent oxidoreductase n=1 Tax=Antrihabitans stalactiti TaxID=2584121 RepID=A0A848KK34_9NOCA|nr:FAD-dependent oxidoreductase [Antrihabitans stalactiti]NMN99055.1 NAD(P)/FAD-dependent oxidoreductase [Antrihabitans stalactiti]
MIEQTTHVIVGASLAGAKAAETLRAEGFDGRIVLIGAENELPYERPPLSKGFLIGRDDKSKIFVHADAWYQDNSVELMLGRQVTRLDRGTHTVELDGGERIRYSKVLLATGASPRRLEIPGGGLDGIHYLRRVTDAERLRSALSSAPRVVVVGAGWIGLETAAAARELGCHVTVVEPRQAPLLAALGPEMGGFFADLHREHGVDVRLGHGVTEIRGATDRVSAVVTDDGSVIPAEAVIVGVGARPNVELAAEAELPVDNGVLVDQSLRTDDPDVYAAGDVANAFHPHYARPVRVEHWANALHGGQAAAKSMLGQSVSYDRLPYFFTDQYDVGMEYTGWFPPGGYDAVVTRGDVVGKSFHAFWFHGGRVVAGMHVNRWDDGVGAAQALITSRTMVDRDRLADLSVPLAQLADPVPH